MASLERFGNALLRRQRWVLLGLLVVLHLTLVAGVASPVGLTFWLVDVGFFILWQPFFRAERRLDYGNLVFIATALAVGAWLYGWWLLLVWVALLAALLGGRVMLVTHRPTRIFYLLAFAYLVGAVLIWLMPKLIPNTALGGLSLEPAFAWGAPALFLGMALLPRPPQSERVRQGVFDFYYGLFIFLLLSVLVLGCLSFVLIGGLLYYEALFRTVISMAVLLLVVAWLWSPRPGFGGVETFLSQYLLTIGLPFDIWLRQLVECAEREDDPDRFLTEVGERLCQALPWVVGGVWSPALGADVGSGAFGTTSPHMREYSHGPLVLRIHVRHSLSPVLIWHLHLLTRVASEYYLAKWRARALQQMSYLRAVHETGARVTHEVKNLLQSLDGLCYLAETSGEGDAAGLQQLVRRQLPQIGRRLRQTLEKLQPPTVGALPAPEENVAAADWWDALRQRFPHKCIHYAPVNFDVDARLPSVLFDSVADNLLHNAMIKQQSEHTLCIEVSLSADASILRVSDDGSALSEVVAVRLFRQPIASESGFGIGLLNAASQATAQGYALRLVENTPGHVRFELAKAVMMP